jgi:hypothetical protein
MARPRRDGKPAARAVRTGRERRTESGRLWRVRAYAKTSGAPYGRVVFTHPAIGKPTSSVPEDGQTLDEKFDQVEKWLDQNVAIGSHVADDSQPGTRKRRDMNARCDLYLDFLAAPGLRAGLHRQPEELAQRACAAGHRRRPGRCARRNASSRPVGSATLASSAPGTSSCRSTRLWARSLSGALQACSFCAICSGTGSSRTGFGPGRPSSANRAATSPRGALRPDRRGSSAGVVLGRGEGSPRPCRVMLCGELRGRLTVTRRRSRAAPCPHTTERSDP